MASVVSVTSSKAGYASWSSRFGGRVFSWTKRNQVRSRLRFDRSKNRLVPTWLRGGYEKRNRCLSLVAVQDTRHCRRDHGPSLDSRRVVVFSRASTALAAAETAWEAIKCHESTHCSVVYMTTVKCGATWVKRRGRKQEDCLISAPPQAWAVFSHRDSDRRHAAPFRTPARL